MSPVGGRSTVITSAPCWARIMVAKGPDRFIVRSTTRTPASGPPAASVIAAPYSARTLRGRPEIGPGTRGRQVRQIRRSAVATTDEDVAIESLLDTLERWLASDVVP